MILRIELTRTPHPVARQDPAGSNSASTDRHRAEAESITAQARWLYEIHARRSESAMQRATAVIAIAGVLLTLAPTALSKVENGWQLGLLVGALVVAAVTILLGVTVQLPRKSQGPATFDLRIRWLNYRTGKKSGLAAQVAEDMLRSKTLNEPSASEFAKDDADYRIRRLKFSYWFLGVALILTSALTTVAALQGRT